MYLFASFYELSTRFWNCSDNVLFVFSLILAQIVSLYKTKPFHKSQQCGRFVFHFVTYLVYIYKTYIYILTNVNTSFSTRSHIIGNVK